MKLSFLQKAFLHRATFKILGYQLTVFDLWANRFCFELTKAAPTAKEQADEFRKKAKQMARNYYAKRK
jgi:hypothetical protein